MSSTKPPKISQFELIFGFIPPDSLYLVIFYFCKYNVEFILLLGYMKNVPVIEDGMKNGNVPGTIGLCNYCLFNL